MKGHKPSWRIWGVAALLGMMVGGLPALAEEEEGLSIDASLTAISQYIWRGAPYSKPDQVIWQPSLTLGIKGLSFNVWASLDDNKGWDGMGRGGNEVDFTASYGWEAGKFGFEVGYLYYDLNRQPMSHEVFGSACLDVWGEPTFKVYREVGDFPGWYYEVSGSKSVPAGEKITVDFGASMGYMTLSEIDYHALHNLQLNLGLTVPFSDTIRCKPMVAWSTGLTGDSRAYIRDVAESFGFKPDTSFFFAGVTFEADF